MDSVLPKETGLIVNRILYNYSVNKVPEDDFTVTISNDNAKGTGKIFSETDDWSGKPGNMIVKSKPVANIPRVYWGDGSIETTGTGEVVDANIKYGYTFDDCADPLANPECPQDKLLLVPVTEDPYDNVKDYLAKETDTEEEEREDNDSELDDEDKRKELAKVNSVLFADANRIAILFEQLAQVPQFNTYYEVKIDGKSYDETIELKDATLPDNRRAFRSFATDEKFDTIKRSQYERVTKENK